MLNTYVRVRLHGIDASREYIPLEHSSWLVERGMKQKLL